MTFGQNTYKELEVQITDLNQRIGGITGMVARLQEETRNALESQLTQEETIRGLTQNAGDKLALWLREYENQTTQKSYAQFRDNYERRRKANQTLREKPKDLMVDRMIAYKTEHDFGAAASLEGFPEFAEVYQRLRTSELLDYEERVQSARRAAEDEFREQFLAKLQENMKQAQGEFKELNKALKDITFSNERYEFLFMPSKKYRSYYEMIMDDFNIVQGESIFSGIFHETHKEVIEELFDRLA